MKNKKSIALLTLSTLVAWLVVSISSADFSESNFKSDRTEMKQDFRKVYNWNMKGLSDDEKTNLETMTDEEKKEFFEAKKAERNLEKEAKKIERESHENVIDKLLAWEELTAEEELTRTDIIEKRAERKIQKEANEAKREEMKIIMEKVHSDEELTDEEQAKLDEIKLNFKGKKKWYKKGWNRWWIMNEK